MHVCEHASVFLSYQCVWKTPVTPFLSSSVCFEGHMCIVKRHTLPTSEEQTGNRIHSFLSIPRSVDCSGIELNARNIDTMLTT